MNNIKIEKIYFCPHAPEEKCNCRKPSPKFLNEAKQEYNLNLKESWVIGDHPYDIELAQNVGCKSVYVLMGHGEKHLKEVKGKPDFIASNLFKAAQYILRNSI